MQIRYFDAVSSDEFTIAKGIPKHESPKICFFFKSRSREEKREEKNVKFVDYLRKSFQTSI